MAENEKRSSMVYVAIVLSSLNLALLIAGGLWVVDSFQEAEREEQSVAETLRAKFEALNGASRSLGGVLIVSAFVFGLIWLGAFYSRAARKAALHRQATELNSYLGNRSRDKKGRRTRRRLDPAR